MENMITEIAKQVPSLGVLAFIVIVFLRHMERRDAVIKEIHAEHMLERKETRAAVDANTAEMQRNTLAISKFVKSLNN